MTPTARQNIRDGIKKALDNGKTLEQAVDGLRRNPHLWGFVRPLLIDVGRSVQREHTRGKEERTDKHWHQARAVPAVPGTAQGPKQVYVVPQELLELQSEWFPLADGTHVFWFLATIEQHQARIDMQLKLIGGCQRDVARHGEAIRVLEETGAINLAALPSTYFKSA